jgi:hypothetical protein
LRQQREESGVARSKRTIALAEELASLEHLERRKIDVELHSEPLIPVDSEGNTHQRVIQQQHQEKLKNAIGVVEAEYAEKFAQMRGRFRQQMAGSQSSTENLQSRTQGGESAPRPKTDPLRFLEEQHKDLVHRQQALAHARHEWADGNVEPVTQDQLTKRKAVHAFKGTLHADPNIAPQQEPEPSQVAHILSKLSNKLDSLTAKVASLEAPEQARHDHDNIASSDLDNKWSAILQQLNRGNRNPDYTDAVRRYCGSE